MLLTCAAGLVVIACRPFLIVSPDPNLQFYTNSFSNLNRPDSAIAVGPKHVVTAVNFQMQVQDLDGSNPTPIHINSFFPGDPTASVGDPRLVYDAGDDRFIVSYLGFDYVGQKGPSDLGDSYCDVAISATGDPRGNWYKYTFHVLRGTQQMDFDSLGYDGKAIYVTGHMRDFANNLKVSGNRILILNKATALAGGALTPTIVEDLALPSGAGPADIVKPVEPLDPAALAGPTYFLTESGNSALVLYTLTDPLGAHTFTSKTIPIKSWAAASGAPQGGGPPLLEQAAGVVLQKTTLRNGVIWTAHSPSATGNANGNAGVIVYRIKPTTGTLIKQYAISDPSLWYYLPAVVPDSTGNAAVVFAASDPNLFASIFYARYEASADKFDLPYVVAKGTTTYAPKPESSEAWGDYFDAAPDVTSGNRVWLHGELADTKKTWKMSAARVATDAPPIQCANQGLAAGVSCLTN